MARRPEDFRGMRIVALTVKRSLELSKRFAFLAPL
jgi:hypothetical protein